MSTPTVSFWFDYLSPYTFLASTQIDRVCAAHGVVARWEPALLGGIMKASGNQPPALLVPRAEYMGPDLARWAEHYGVAFRFSPHFPFSPVAALRAALAIRASAPDRAAAWDARAFRAAWQEGSDLADKGVLAALARDVQVDEALVLAANDDPVRKEQLKAQTERVVGLGAFGLPWVVVEQDGARETYFGNDRLPLLDARLARARPWTQGGGAVRL